MVDNININRSSPLLSSAERVKPVDRRQRDRQQPPFKGAQEKEQKKKKKKKKKQNENKSPSEALYARDGASRHARATAENQEQENKMEPEQKKKIIDIRV